MTEKKVSIVVLNFNGTADTLECLRSLAQCPYPNMSVIVVDNASDDVDALAVVMRDEFPDVRFIRHAFNAGFAGGNNVGIRAALEHGSEYVLLLNNDTTVAHDCVERMVAAAESDARIGIVGAKIYFHGEPDHIWFDGADFSWTDGGRHVRYDERDTDPNDVSVNPTTFVTGCAMLISRAVIEKIGLLEEAFFMYYEDIDYSLHAARAGFLLRVAEGAHVWHKVSRASARMGTPRIHYYHVRNALLNASRNAPFVTKAAVYVWSVYHLKKQVLKYIALPHRRDIAVMIMRGITDFYQGRFGKLQN